MPPLTITDAELIRALVWSLGTMLAGISVVAWWGVRKIVFSVTSMRDVVEAFKEEVRREIRGLDRRVTRVEAILRLPTPHDGDAFVAAYVGPERRAGD